MGLGAGMGASRTEQEATPHGSEQRLANAPSSASSDQLKGRTIVDAGQPISVAGNLKQNGQEWQVVSGDICYDIHLGPEEYRRSLGIELVEGQRVGVTGFAIDEDIAVRSLELEGRTHVFRNEDGRPAWAGGGMRGRPVL